jgi:hypothetical protein
MNLGAVRSRHSTARVRRSRLGRPPPTAPKPDTRETERENELAEPVSSSTTVMRKMFKLIATVRRGSASNLQGAYDRYPTVEEARSGATALLRHERVVRVMIVRNGIPPVFVEWSGQ